MPNDVVAGGLSAPHQLLLEFAGYTLDLNKVELRHGAAPVAVEPQVFNLLVFLVTHRDRMVSKDELLDELWGHRFVSESALSTQIKAARRVVGDNGRDQRLIKTIHGRGFRFVAPVADMSTDVGVGGVSAQPAATPRATAVSNTPNPGNISRDRLPLFGREDEISRCLALLADNRLVTLLGIGGTGKTRLAKAVGRAATARFPEVVWFIDLVPLANEADIYTGIAAALGLSMQSGASRSQLVNAISLRRALFIIDNCEHMLDACTSALDTLLEQCELPVFLTTSRDPLALPDECRFFVEPLACDAGAGADAPALQLFNATAGLHGVTDVLTDTLVREVCTHLDGIPLAIELAAAQLRYLSLQQLSDRLHQRFELLHRNRSPQQRQSSLLGVIADTWALLTPGEQTLLGGLTVFRGAFTLADAEELLNATPAEIGPQLARLVELCLLSRTSAPGAWWRVLETVREYAVA